MDKITGRPNHIEDALCQMHNNQWFTWTDSKNKIYAKGRVCKQKGCDKTISMYNKKDWCYSHAPISYGRNRGWIDPAKKKG